jgi:hypothetical protein
MNAMLQSGKSLWEMVYERPDREQPSPRISLTSDEESLVSFVRELGAATEYELISRFGTTSNRLSDLVSSGVLSTRRIGDSLVYRIA